MSSETKYPSAQKVSIDLGIVGCNFDLMDKIIRRAIDLYIESRQVAKVPGLHPMTDELIDKFALALKEKLAAAQARYGFGAEWADAAWMDECRAKLIEHIAKGDPRDVANYCAFLWHHGERTS